MTAFPRFARLSALAVCLAAVAGCGAAPPTEAPPTAHAVEPTLARVEVETVDEVIIHVEDGGCSYPGPFGIAAGKVTFILDNPRAANMQASVSRFDAGETWDQLTAAFADRKRGVEYPAWVEDNFLSARPVIDNPRAKIYDLTPGSYAITCEEFPPEGTIVIWPVAAFEVR